MSPGTLRIGDMAAFDRPGGKGLWLPSVAGAIPPNPASFGVNWGTDLAVGLGILALPHPSGYYLDLVRRRRLAFGGAGTTTPVSTAFGSGFQMGSTAGGVGAYAQVTDAALEPPTPPVTGGGAGITLASGCYNQGTISNVTMEFCSIHDLAFSNALTLYVANVGGIPRFEINCTAQSSNTNLVANGGAGITMTTSGQYMSHAASYNGATILADYTTTGLGHNTGSVSKTGWPTGIIQAAISDTSASLFNSGRTMLWFAFWLRALTAAELQTLTSYVGGLPPGLLRQR